MSPLDALRYALADALYRAEGRYGTLRDEVRWSLDDDCTCGWATELRRIHGEVEALLADEFDDRRKAGCVESLRLIDELLAALAAAAPTALEAA
ncbi:hypothetical protein WMF30_10925 [Sorangium sp. So ce134]